MSRTSQLGWMLLLPALLVGCGDSAPAVDADQPADQGIAGEGTVAPRELGGPGLEQGAQPDGPRQPDGAVGSAFTFFAMGDTRSQPTYFQATVTSMVKLDPKAVAMFNDGDLTATGTAAEWTTHNNVLKNGSNNLVRRDLTGWDPTAMRYIGVIGNHDIGNADWFTNWNTNLPGQKALGHNASDGIYFSLTYKDALFVVLDSHHTTAPQTTWLTQLLATSEAKAARWRFAFWHRPVYPCNDKTPYSGAIPWVRLLEQAEFDIVFVADSHTYERTCPMLNGKCVSSGGIVYLNSSGAGAPVRAVLPDKAATVGTDSYHCAAQGSEAGILTKGIGNWYHYCHVDIAGDTLTLRAISHDSTTDVKDTLKLTKK